MTVLQFRPRTPEPVSSQATAKSPAYLIKAWLCIVIGLSISPWIHWLEILSERDEEPSRQGRN